MYIFVVRSVTILCKLGNEMVNLVGVFHLNKTEHYTSRSRNDRRKYFFAERIVSVWNSLPVNIVNAASVRSFKTNFDSFWKEERLIYKFKASLACIGARGILA